MRSIIINPKKGSTVKNLFLLNYKIIGLFPTSPSNIPGGDVKMLEN